MITMTLLHFVAVIAFTLLDGYYLGRTAFACYPVRRVLTYFASGTTRSMHDRLHRLAGIFPVLGVAQLNIRQWLWICYWLAIHTTGQVWAYPFATGSHQGRSLSQLQRRTLHVALADAQNQGFSRIPGLTVALTLPLARRHQPCTFLKHVKRHPAAKAKQGHVFMQAVNAQLVGQIVKVGIVGARYSQLQPHPAVPTTIPVTILVTIVRQLIKAWIKDRRLWRNHAGIKPGQHHHWLDGGAWRIEPAQHPVIQRLINRIAQLGIG